MNKKVALVGGGYSSYAQMFLIYGWTVVENIYDADLIQFTGGEDVSPNLYGEKKHPYTGCSPERDAKELMIYESYVDKKPMAGICRGGQFLNVVNGGKMYQDVDGHAIAGLHDSTDLQTGRRVRVSSTHHQMMRPSHKGEILCIANRASYKEHMIGDEVHRVEGMVEDDVEVILYRDTSCLCFQPHPEFVVYSPEVGECADYYFECLEEIV